MWPDSPFATVKWRLATVNADSSDLLQHPDWVPATGTRVTLTPSVSGTLVYVDPVTEEKTSLTLAPVSGVIDADGYLCHVDGTTPTSTEGFLGWSGRQIAILATDSPNLSVSGWVWQATLPATSPIRFSAPAGTEVDLSDYILAPAVPSPAPWLAQIPTLVQTIQDAIAIGQGPQGPAGPPGPPEQFVYVPNTNVSGTLNLSSYTTTDQPLIHLTAVGDITTVTLPSSPAPGLTITLIITSGAPNTTITFPPNVRSSYSDPPQLTPDAGATDIINLTFTGAMWVAVGGATAL